MYKNCWKKQIWEGLEAGWLDPFWDSLGVVIDFFDGEVPNAEYVLLIILPAPLALAFSSLILSKFY